MKEGAPESSRAAAQRAKHEAAGRKEPKRGRSAFHSNEKKKEIKIQFVFFRVFV